MYMLMKGINGISKVLGENLSGFMGNIGQSQAIELFPRMLVFAIVSVHDLQIRPHRAQLLLDEF